jgi:hypothetical protein
MKREDFVGLPAAVALGCLWDEIPELRERLEALLVPKIPMSPKYDNPIYRKEGIQWCSETDLNGLRYWKMRADESAASGGQYAEKDAKRSKQLGFWIAWRTVDPSSRWTGERNNTRVTAEAPSDKPAVYPSTPRVASFAREERKPMSFDEDGKVADAFGDDSEIPF